MLGAALHPAPEVRDDPRGAERMRQVRRHVGALALHADGALRVSVRAHRPGHELLALPLRHVQPAAEQGRRHGRHPRLPLRLRRQNPDLSDTHEQTRHRVRRDRLGLGAADPGAHHVRVRHRWDESQAVGPFPQRRGFPVGRPY